MARTKTVTRSYIDEVIDLKFEIDRLQARKHELAKKLAVGTHRSLNHPGFKVVISPGMSNGYKVDWKGIVEGLAARFKLDLNKLMVGNRQRITRSPSCSVLQDRVRFPLKEAV